jgi:hypothetical protein
MFAYASTQLISDEQNTDDFYTIDQCAQVESKSCCKQAARHNIVSGEGMRNCHLCGHPDCTGVTAQQDDPGISLPFKKNIVNVIKPNKGTELYDMINNYAYAYAGRVTYV